MDQRGHGKSEGKVAYVPSVDQITDDTIQFQRMVLDTFYQGQTPKVFAVAHSLGAMQLLNMLVRDQENHVFNPYKYAIKYDSIAMLNPFWGLVDKKTANKMAPIVRGIHFLNKNAMAPE